MLEHHKSPTDKELAEMVQLAWVRYPVDEAARDTLIHRLQYGRGRLGRRAWIEAFVKIEDRAKRLVPFTLNYGQRWALARMLKRGRAGEAFVDPDTREVLFKKDGGRWRELSSGHLFEQPPRWAWDELERRLGPIQAIVLKARQIGISTLVQMLIFEACVRGDGTNAKLISHDEDTNKQVWNKQRKARENLPFDLPLLSNNESEQSVEYAAPLNSGMTASSAQSKRDVGRGGTFQMGHFTELPQWEPRAGTIMTGLLSAFHAEPECMLVAESTAKGAIGWFYDTWYGSNDWLRVFLPWFVMEDYRLPLDAESKEQLRATLDDPRYSVEGEESWLLDQTYFRRFHGYVTVDLEQVAWRRWCIDNRMQGDLDRFRQEYPAYPKEAFLASGRPVFNGHVLEDRLSQQLPDPVVRGDLAPMDFEEFFRVSDPVEFFERRPEARVVENRYGPMRVWKMPERGKTYGMGIDTSEGHPGGDPSALYVIELESAEIVLEYHGFFEPIDLARTAMRIGWWYNQAIIAPEKNNHGYALLIELVQRCCYPNVFLRSKLDELGRPLRTDFGWDMKSNTRRVLFDFMRAFIRVHAEKIPCEELLREMQGMTYNDRGQEVSPPRGWDGGIGHDDRVIAYGIALQIREEAFRNEIVQPPAPPKLPYHQQWEQVADLLSSFEIENEAYAPFPVIPRDQALGQRGA